MLACLTTVRLSRQKSNLSFIRVLETSNVFCRDSELNGVVWLMFAFCINKFMKNVRTHVCGTAKGRCCFPMKRKWKSAKPLEQGSAYLTQLQYIINLLCEKRTKDNVADSRQRRKKTSVI